MKEIINGHDTSNCNVDNNNVYNKDVAATNSSAEVTVTTMTTTNTNNNNANNINMDQITCTPEHNTFSGAAVVLSMGIDRTCGRDN